MKNLLFAVAVILMTLAHFIRTLRWELFIKVYEKPQKKRLSLALSLGFLINFLVPYKLGDLFRGLFSGKTMKNGKALGLSTVVVDRYLDVLAVGLVFGFLALINKSNESIVSSAKLYIFFFSLLVILTALVYSLKRLFKRLIRKFAGIFNQQIEITIMKFAWAVIWNFKDIFLKINKARLLIYSVGMWALYICSYSCFAGFVSMSGKATTWTDMFIQLFSGSGIKASTFVNSFSNSEMLNLQIAQAVYLLIPLVLVVIMTLMFRKETQETVEEDDYLNLIPQLNPEERLVFLDKYFSDQNQEYIVNYLKINQNISIIRDYSAGSNATTMLCVDENGSFFRKYALGADGHKLAGQIEWINNNKETLPLPDIMGYEANEDYCYYDMPYLANSIGMFEYAHSMPVEKSWTIIEDVLHTLENTIYKVDVRDADKKTVLRYIDEKVFANLNKITSHGKMKELTSYDTICINGIEYKNLPAFDKLFNRDFLLKAFEHDYCSVIHGDLTIENIVCVRSGDREDSFYLIDPNTGNVHDSYNLDYAKLLQSIHGGYEFLMTVKNVKVSGNNIDFIFIKSAAYSQLYERFHNYLNERFTKETVRSIYLHELVHWLRLVPYKINKDIRLAPVFYAGMILVLNDIYNMYGDDIED